MSHVSLDGHRLQEEEQSSCIGF